MKAPPHTDLTLFKLIAAGDERAFTQIFYKYSDEIFSYCIKILHSKFWAEEAVQNLFFQVWARRQTLGTVENPRAYLFRIAANRCIDLLRKHEQEIRLQYETREQTTGNEIEERLDLRASESLVHKAIESLPEKRRLVYQLKNNQGMSYDQIASHLQLSTHTVRNHLSKALDNIRTYLLSHGIFLVLFTALFNIF